MITEIPFGSKFVGQSGFKQIIGVTLVHKARSSTRHDPLRHNVHPLLELFNSVRVLPDWHGGRNDLVDVPTHQLEYPHHTGAEARMAQQESPRVDEHGCALGANTPLFAAFQYSLTVRHI